MTRPSRPRRGCLLPRLGAALALAAAVLALACPASADPTPAPTPGPPRPTPSPIGPPPTTRPTTPPPGTPAPTPGPNPTTNPTINPTPPAGTEDDPAWYDIPGQIRVAISEFFAWIARQALQPVLDALGRTVLATPDVTGNDRVRDVWNTCAVIANTCFVLFLVAAGYLLTARETLQTRYGLKDLLPRLGVAAIVSNTSLLLASKAIGATNALTAAILGTGVEAGKAGAALAQTMTLSLEGTSILGSLMGLAVLVMAIVVLVTYVMRLAMLVVLVGMAPIALCCHALPQTEGIAYTWWRAFTGVLGIQLGQALVLLVMLRVLLTPAGDTILGFPSTSGGLIGLVLMLALLHMLIKIPVLMRHYILGPRRGPSLIGQTIRLAVAAKTFGALAGAGKAGAGAATRRSAGRGTGGTAGGGLPGGPGPGPRPTRPGSGSPMRPGAGGPGRTPQGGTRGTGRTSTGGAGTPPVGPRASSSAAGRGGADPAGSAAPPPRMAAPSPPRRPPADASPAPRLRPAVPTEPTPQAPPPPPESAPPRPSPRPRPATLPPVPSATAPAPTPPTRRGPSPAPPAPTPPTPQRRTPESPS